MSRALTRAEFERWLGRFGQLLDQRQSFARAARSSAEAARDPQVASWADPNNHATRPQDPVLRGEFCQALYGLLERNGH